MIFLFLFLLFSQYSQPVFSHGNGKQPQSLKFQVSTYHPPSVGQDDCFEVVNVEQPHCINDCGMYGYPDAAGLCSQCFRKEQQALKENEMADQDKGLQMPVGPSMLIPNVQQLSVQTLPHDDHPVNLERRTECRTPGCEFFGTAETCFYCSQCFEADTENILKEFENPTPVISHTHLPSAALIKEQGSRTYSTEPQTNQHEPKKCYNCREFFTNEEYQGLCHACFLERTKVDTASSPRKVSDYHEMSRHTDHIIQPVHTHYPGNRQQPYIPRYEKCANLDCQGPQTENGYCDNCNMLKKSNSQQQQASYEHIPHMEPYGPSPLAQDRFGSPTLSTNLPLSTQGGQTYTRPAAHVRNTRHSNDDNDQCYLCFGKQVTTKNFVCQHHAELMKEMLFYRKGIPNYRRQAQGHDMISTTQPRQELIRGSDSRKHQVYPNKRVELSTEVGSPDPFMNVTNSVGVSSYPKSPSNVSVRKLLCVTPGCSFKGYEEIYNLCPDCYEFANPGKKAPDHLPLV